MLQRIMKPLILVFTIALMPFLLSCQKEDWKPGTPLAKEKLKIGVLHVSDPFSEKSGYSYAHETGIQEMKRSLDLKDNQLLHKIHVSDTDPPAVESAMRELIAQGVNIIVATSWGYMDSCEKLAGEFPGVVFAHASGHKRNFTNFTNYFGRIYQARYLSGIVAGLKTKTGKIGYVAAMGKDNSEVTGGINAFALGVEKANPEARVYVKVTYSWFDPMGEGAAARALIDYDCDVIAQHCDSSIPQEEAEKAGLLGIGYNSDMSAEAPGAVLCSVLWRWGVYYKALVRSVMDGSFTTTPWFGSLKDGIVDLSPLNEKFQWEPETLRLLEDERQRIESGELAVFGGVMETNDGRSIGQAGGALSDDEIRGGIDWYYHTVVEL